jgi:trehalose 6-phosphate phosphatase
MSVPLSDALNEIASRVQAAPHVLLFCDFDGALAPVYDNPAAASLSAEVRPLLADLAASGRVTVTVVSGRSASDLRSRANMPGLIVAGNHGLEIAGPGWDYVDRAVATSAPNVSLLTAALAKATENIRGVFLEDKKLSVSVHFRHVPTDQHEAVRSAVHGVLGGTSHPFVLTAGRMVYDIRPRVYWHKGEAVKWIAGRVRQPDALVVFVGGDPTDEDAFAALPHGVTVRVGPGMETAAKYCLEGPDGVRKFLEWLREQVRPRRTGR